MNQRGGAAPLLAILVSAALLLWPAALNGYPLVFGDTGVYLMDGIHLHVSWPRPLFYGLFMLPLHWKITAWPVVIAQAVIATTVLYQVVRAFVPGLARWALIPVTLVLTVCTSLPWFVSQLMPDVFGGLMLLALAVLILAPSRLRVVFQPVCILFAAGCIALHQTFLPVAMAALVVLLVARAWQRDRVRLADLLRAAAVPALALCAAVGVNAVLIGQVSPSPYGKLFLLTRVLLDGPGQRALARECPRPDWTLCAFKDSIPTTPESIQFGEDGLFTRAGGYRAIAPQVWPIVLSAVRAEPQATLINGLRGAAWQFIRFRTGDGLIVPMPDVLGAWRAEFPPAEQARYEAGKQFQLIHLVPDWLQALHVGAGAVALLVLVIGAGEALWRRSPLGGLYAAILIALVANAVMTGALSGVYDRYQSRFMWLAPLAALLMLLDWWRQLNRDRLRGSAPS